MHKAYEQCQYNIKREKEEEEENNLPPLKPFTKFSRKNLLYFLFFQNNIVLKISPSNKK